MHAFNVRKIMKNRKEKKRKEKKRKNNELKLFLLAYPLRLHGREEVEVGNCETPTGFHWPLQLLISDYNTIFLSLTSYNMVVGGLAVIYIRA